MTTQALNITVALDPQQALAALSNLQQHLAATAAAAQTGASGNPLQNVTAGAAAANTSVTSLASTFVSLQAVVLAAATGAMATFAKASVDSATTAEAAFKGLESVSNRTGVGIERAWKAVQDVTADGVLSQSQAATAFKNLFSFGITDAEKAAKIIDRIKDAAAYGRQAGLDWGEAVVTATEGIRNENSALVDNAGVTKNVAKMYEEYADKIGVVSTSLTKADKVQAITLGILKETELQVGDTGKALQGVSGSSAHLAQAWGGLKTAVGDELTPAFYALQNAGASLLTNVLTPLVHIGAAIYKTFDGVATAVSDASTAFGKFKRPEDVNAEFDRVRNRKKASIAYSISRAFGIEVPSPIPEGNTEIPPLSTNHTGIPVAGPDGKILHGPTAPTYNVKNDIDKTAAAKRAKTLADEEEKAKAKQQLDSAAKALARAKQTQSDELSIYKSGLDAQKAELDGLLARNAITHTEYAKRVAAIDLDEAQKTLEQTQARQLDLQKSLELATKSGDKEKVAEAQSAYDSEIAAATVAANKIKQVRLQTNRDVSEAGKQDAAQRRDIDEKLFQARANAEKTSSAAIRERELAGVQQLYDARQISEEEFLKRSAALKDTALAADLERLKEQQAFDVTAPVTTDPVQQAARSAKSTELSAQIVAVEQQRQQLALETDGKIAQSAINLADLRRGLEQELADAEGRSFDARSVAIDQWLEEKRRELAAFPDLLKRAETVAAAQRRENEFGRAQDAVGQVNSQFDSSQAALERQSRAGTLTDIQLDQQSLALKREQAAALRERLDLLKEFSNDSPAALQAIRQVEDQIAELDTAFSTTAQQINESFFSSIEKGFQDIATGAKRPLDALRDLVISTLTQIASFALKSGLQSAFGSSMTSGGLGGFLAGIFGGFRVNGGDIEAGKAYVVGERGPELMLAGTNGTIVSHEALKRSLSSTYSRQFASPMAMVPNAAAYSPAAAPVPASGDTHVNVHPRVTVATGAVIAALRQDPEFERLHVELSVANKRKINGSTG
ncbi:hypothetical protein RugamoR57_37590 [Duganella caerulea]|uniref:hypothetical protein n=1 Tax=Duganella caerulea TaxID=2885762 RepID=UPI0030EA438A